MIKYENESSPGKGPPYINESYASIFLWDLKRLRPWRFFRKAGIKYFHDHSPFAATIVNNPGGFEALEKIYLNRPVNWLDRKFLSFRACEGTRQRLKIYEKVFYNSIAEMASKNGKVRLLDLGSGSGRGVLGAAQKFIQDRPEMEKSISIRLSDVDKKALGTARVLSMKLGLSGITTTKHYNAKRISETEPPKRYSIVGTHGLLDYFTDDEAVKFFRDISNLLIPGGIVIASNMLPHDDWFTKWMMEYFGNWWLIYRTPKELKGLVEKSGGYEDIRTIIVPMCFHTIVMCVRRS